MGFLPGKYISGLDFHKCACILTSTVKTSAWRFMPETSGLFNSKRAVEQAKIKYENLSTILDEPLIKLKFDIICLYVSPFIKMHENGRKNTS